MTGFKVAAATTPGSAADNPATAINTSAPLFFARSATRSGVRCADATAISYSISNDFKILVAFSATGKSLLLPNIIRTRGMIGTTPCKLKRLWEVV